MSKRKSNFCAEGCPVEAAIEHISGKWKGVILYHLMKDKTLRFGELRRRLPGVTQRMLTKQLRELEGSGVLNRMVYPEVPPKVEYSLTEFGDTLWPVIRALEVWGNKHGK